MTDQPTLPESPADVPAASQHRARPADQPPSVAAADSTEPAADESTRQAQDTVRSISRLEESN